MKNNKMFAGFLVLAAIGVAYWYTRKQEVDAVEEMKEETLAATDVKSTDVAIPAATTGGNMIYDDRFAGTGGIKQAVLSESSVSKDGTLMLDKFVVADNNQELNDNF